MPDLSRQVWVLDTSSILKIKYIVPQNQTAIRFSVPDETIGWKNLNLSETGCR